MIQVEVYFVPAGDSPISGVRNFERVPCKGEIVAGMGLLGERYVVTEVEWKFDGSARITAQQE